MVKRLIFLQALVGFVVFAIGILIQPETALANLLGVSGAFALISVTGFLTLKLSLRPELQFMVMMLELLKWIVAAALLITGFSLLSAAEAPAFGIAFGALYVLSYLAMLASVPNFTPQSTRER